jgi:hypothetical protein
VLSVTSKDDTKFYAVKRSKRVFSTEEGRDLMLKEVRNYEILPPHPNIVAYHMAWVEEVIFFISKKLLR